MKFQIYKRLLLKYLRNENEKVWWKCERIERRWEKYGYDYSTLAQYGRWNNIIISGISDSASDDTFEESVIALLADIDIRVKHQGIEAFRRFGKADRQMCDL